jgi:hypothetical protein
MKTFFLALAYTTGALLTGEPVSTAPQTPAPVQAPTLFTTSTGGLRP